MGREDCGIESFLPILLYCLVILLCMQLMQANVIAKIPHVVYAYDICSYVIAY